MARQCDQEGKYRLALWRPGFGVSWADLTPVLTGCAAHGAKAGTMGHRMVLD